MDKIIKAWDGAAGPTGAGRRAGAPAAVAAAATAICINMVLDAAFCGSGATVCMSGGLEMRKVSLSGGRAGRVMIFLARSILARGHPDRTRCAIMGTMETDIGAQTTWLLESTCIWEVVVGSGGGGGDRLSSEKLAEVGRGDGWGVNRPDAGMGR